MNNSQPSFNDFSGRAPSLMSGVKEADPCGKRVQVCVVQLGVTVFSHQNSSLLATQRCDCVVDVVTQSRRDGETSKTYFA